MQTYIYPFYFTCSTVGVMVTVRAVMPLVGTVAAAYLAVQLNKVDDFIHMSRDIRLVWILLLGMQCEKVGFVSKPMFAIRRLKTQPSHPPYPTLPINCADVNEAWRALRTEIPPSSV